MKHDRKADPAKGASTAHLLASTAVELLASVKFAVAIIVLIAISCVIGTVLPQGGAVAGFIEKHPGAAARMELFEKVGLTHVFSAPWFIALLCVLALTVMTCSTRRFATIRRSTGPIRRRSIGSMLTHLSILLILSGAVVRGVWGEKGRVELRQGEPVARFETGTGPRDLPFTIALAKFEIETEAVSAGSARLAVRNFKSTLHVLDGGRVGEASLAVNRPLKFRGYTFYQSGYNPADMSWTALEVVRDPGVPLVYAGFVALILGLFVVFYLNPWMTGREARP